MAKVSWLRREKQPPWFPRLFLRREWTTETAAPSGVAFPLPKMSMTPMNRKEGEINIDQTDLWISQENSRSKVKRSLNEPPERSARFSLKVQLEAWTVESWTRMTKKAPPYCAYPQDKTFMPLRKNEGEQEQILTQLFETTEFSRNTLKRRLPLMNPPKGAKFPDAKRPLAVKKPGRRNMPTPVRYHPPPESPAELFTMNTKSSRLG